MAETVSISRQDLQELAMKYGLYSPQFWTILKSLMRARGFEYSKRCRDNDRVYERCWFRWEGDQLVHELLIHKKFDR